jgi:hypothetical protein
MAATYAHKVYIELTFNGQLYMHFIDVTYNIRMITYAISECIFGGNSTLTHYSKAVTYRHKIFRTLAPM